MFVHYADADARTSRSKFVNTIAIELLVSIYDPGHRDQWSHLASYENIKAHLVTLSPQNTTNGAFILYYFIRERFVSATRRDHLMVFCVEILMKFWKFKTKKSDAIILSESGCVRLRVCG